LRGQDQAEQAFMFLSNLLKLRFGVNDLQLQLLERSIIGLEMHLDNCENFAKTLCRLDEGFVRAEPYDILHDVVHAAEARFR
jgi:hypothetical protein